jgi:RNA polymerase sigma-70 factor, ECF subfamily
MKNMDQELVSGCLRGNEDAWEDLVHAHARRIYSLSYRFTRCRAEAEDLTQDVFVRVYQTLSSYQGEVGSLSGWLIHVARNLLIDRYRKTRRYARVDSIEESELPIQDPGSPQPLQHLEQNETAAIVRAALERLSPDTRIVIVLHDLDALTLADVAALLHIPLGTVKSRLIRGRRELARILQGSADRQLRSDRSLENPGQTASKAPARGQAPDKMPKSLHAVQTAGRELNKSV